MFKWFRVGPLLALLLLLLIPARAFATKPCEPLSVQEQMSQATAIVYGRLYKVKTAQSLVHTIVPERVYKGDPPTPISAGYLTTEAASPYAEGQLYTFYLTRTERGDWQIISCAPNHEGTPTTEEAALFGEGRAPAPPDTSRLWIPIVAMGVAVGGVLAVVVRNRLGRKPKQ